MIITTQDRADMTAWLRHEGIAPSPMTVDALIQFLRHLYGGDSHGHIPSAC